MKIKSLKQKILLSVSLALACAILLISGFSYHNLRQQILADGYAQIHSLGSEGARSISEWLSGKQQAIEALASQPNLESARELQLTKNSAGLLTAYYGDETGAMRDENPQSDYSGYDPRTRPWYQQAKATNTVITTEPYIDATTKKLVITLAKSAQQGVIGGDITIDKVLETVNALRLPANGFTILADKNGTTIAYQEQDKQLKPMTAINPQLDGAYLDQLQQAQGLQELDWHGTPKLAWAVNIPHSSWELVFVLDKETLLAPLQTQFWQQAGIALLVLVLSLAAIGALVDVLFRPLRVVSRALEHIAGNGDLTQRIHIQTQDEVGQLAANFNQFVESLHKLIGHIRQEAESLGNSAAMGLKRSANNVHELGNQQQEIAMVATAVTEMAAAVAERTGGEIKIELYPSGQLGENSQVTEQISLGGDIIGQVGVGTIADYVPDFSIIIYPFLYPDYDAAKTFLKSDLIKDLEQQAAEKANARVLCYLHFGVRDLYTRDKEVRAHEQAHMAAGAGLVTRGASHTRVTCMWCSKVVSHSSSTPLTGAAEDGSGVQARGMCPSPANRPEVGSRPIQPAPGR